MPFGFVAPNTFIIIWHSNLSILSVPNEGYRNVPCALRLISTFLLNRHQRKVYFTELKLPRRQFSSKVDGSETMCLKPYV